MSLASGLHSSQDCQRNIDTMRAGWEELLFDAGAASPHAIIQAWGGSRHPANITALGRQAINSLSPHFYTGVANGSFSWARAHADVGLGVPPSQRSLLVSMIPLA